MNCEIFQKEYPFPTSELPSEGVRHIESCEVCQKYWEDGWKYIRAIQATPSEFPMEKIRRDLLERIHQHKVSRAFPRLWFSLGFVSVLALVLIWFLVTPSTEQMSRQFFFQPSLQVEQMLGEFLPEEG